MEGFLWNLMLGMFTNICQHILILVKHDRKIQPFHEDLLTLVLYRGWFFELKPAVFSVSYGLEPEENVTAKT